jgi:endonuclease/exonuclease/phosphatase family metal-dependent hydrolase
MMFFALARPAAADSLEVMTWNIRYDNPKDGINAWPNRKDWVAEIITGRKLDVAGFQEVLVGQFEDLKARLPEMDAYGIGRNDGKAAGEFAPIFFRKNRFRIIDQSTIWLSPTPDKAGSKGWDAALPRIASWVKLEDRQSKGTFVVINTHFDHRGDQAQVESARMLVALVRNCFSDSAVILTGDFNSRPLSRPYQVLTEADGQTPPAFFDSYAHSLRKPEGPISTMNGFRAIAANRRIDFIFTTKTVKTQAVRILDDQRAGRFPSDHLPVVATLELP